jgi:stage II sporulation protein D
MFAIDGQGNTVVVDGGGVVVPPPLTSGRVNVANGVTIRGTGFGHNVGMSQWGALAQAELYGRDFRQILEFYFTGVEVR